jgi:hypothetical protein
VVTVHVWAFLAVYGHRIRKRGARARRMFAGAVAGSCLAGCLALAAGLIPPEAWVAGDTVRGFFGLWSLLVLPVSGASLGALLKPAAAMARAGSGHAVPLHGRATAGPPVSRRGAR